MKTIFVLPWFVILSVIAACISLSVDLGAPPVYFVTFSFYDPTFSFHPLSLFATAMGCFLIIGTITALIFNAFSKLRLSREVFNSLTFYVSVLLRYCLPVYLLGSMTVNYGTLHDGLPVTASIVTILFCYSFLMEVLLYWCNYQERDYLLIKVSRFRFGFTFSRSFKMTGLLLWVVVYLIGQAFTKRRKRYKQKAGPTNFMLF